MDNFFKKLRPLHEFIREKRWAGHIMLLVEDTMNNFISYLYVKRKIDISFLNNLPKNNLWIICVAFNNPILIKKQIESFRKNAGSEITLIIADNSSDKNKRDIIKTICEQEKICYIDLPKNPRTQASLSHSLSLNWIYYNIIKEEQPFAFGFIDHDIFPLSKIDIKEKLNTYDAYGLKQERNRDDIHTWYLWAGFCFYRTAYLNSFKPNFSSVAISNWKNSIGLDTGGGNFERVYKNSNIKVLFAKKQIDSNGSEIIDNWMHIAKASFKNQNDIDNIIKKI
jgi:hypothetical protein